MIQDKEWEHGRGVLGYSGFSSMCIFSFSSSEYIRLRLLYLFLGQKFCLAPVLSTRGQPSQFRAAFRGSPVLPFRVSLSYRSRSTLTAFGMTSSFDSCRHANWYLST